jgi:curved DNA-binding protein
MSPFLHRSNMTNHRTTLGLPDSANADEIKKAFRALAMKHHPDRGGDTATFQTVNSAYMALEASGFAPYVAPRQARTPPPQYDQSYYNEPPQDPAYTSKPEAPRGTWNSGESMDDLLDQMKATRRPPPRNPNYIQPNSEVTMQVPIREASRGFSWRISRQKANGFIEHLDVMIPGGLPDGHKNRYTLSDGSTQVLIMSIDGGRYKLRGTGRNVGTIFEAGITTGDVELDVDVDAIDLITGTWFDVEDFLGERLNVRVPAGFDPNQRLKVAGKGYFGWIEEQNRPATYRRDMYIKLRPVFNPPEKIARDKVLKLYNAVGGWEETNESTST